MIAILTAGHWWQAARDFRQKMFQHWKPSLAITLLYMLGAGIGGVGFQISSIRVFCEALVGLTLAYSLSDYEPLPVTRAIIRKEKWAENIRLMLVTALAVVMAALIVNGLLWSVLLQIFGETTSNPQGPAMVFPNTGWQSFFLLLALRWQILQTITEKQPRLARAQDTRAQARRHPLGDRRQIALRRSHSDM